MEASAISFDPETLARLKHLTLRSRFLLQGLSAGIHRGPKRGQSVEFSEHREYSPGQETRLIDWKVFARSDRLFVKQFEEETNLVVSLLVDHSRSMDYSSRPGKLTKWQYAQVAALTLAYLLLERRDSVALGLIGDGQCPWVGHSSQRRHWQALVHHLDRAAWSGRSLLAESMGIFSQRSRRRQMVLVLSDFLTDQEALFRGLRFLRHQGHDLMLLRITDPQESKFEFQSPARFQSLEGDGWEEVDPVQIAETYRQVFLDHHRRLESFCRSEGFGFSWVQTDQSLLDGVAKLLIDR